MSPKKVDHGVVEKLRKVGGDALVRRMVNLYLVTSEEAVQRLCGALDSNRLDVVQTAAHHLYSSAAQLRFSEVAELAGRLEHAARAGDSAAAHDALGALMPAIGESGHTLRALLAELPQAARVAVIDDSDDVRVLLRLILEPQYDVTEYATASDALIGLHRFPPDLVIIDVTLPDMSGFDLLAFMRSDRALSDIPAIALTALGETAEFERAGFALHVRKPVLDTDGLIRALETVLEARSA